MKHRDSLFTAIGSILFAVLFFGVAGSAFCATIHVPDDFTSIQDAIGASFNGDTIVVRPGTYVENIDFTGKNIVVRSESGPLVTTIDGNQAESVVLCIGGEPATAALDGFTITNGAASSDGGGLRIVNSSPAIRNNIIENNAALSTWGSGGGIYCYSSLSLITNNVITQNSASYEGGGIAAAYASSLAIDGNRFSQNSGGFGGAICCGHDDSVIEKNLFVDNNADAGGAIHFNGSISVFARNVVDSNDSAHQGGGINVNNLSAPLIADNMIYRNRAGWDGGGIHCEGNADPTVTNNTVYGNEALCGGGIHCQDRAIAITNTIFWHNVALNSDPEIHVVNASPDVNYCCVEGGWPTGTGNISSDPLFADEIDDDYHLAYTSPCRDAGSNAAPGIQTEDCEGDPRVATGTVDIGGDEFYYHLYSSGQVVPGGSIEIKVIGYPTAPVILALGSDLLPSPMQTAHGALHFWPIAAQWTIGTVPAQGVLAFPATVPSSWAAGEQKPFQALVGPWGGPYTLLTNLMVLDVE